MFKSALCRRLGARALTAAAMLSVAGPLAAAGPAADTLYVNGTVIPMTGAGDVAQAVAVKDGRILRVGSSADLLRLRGKATRVVDLGGKTMLPGFIDAHGHISMLAQFVDFAQLMPPPVGTVGDMSGLLAALRKQAADKPDGWIVGVGYDDAELAEKRHPTRQELDTVSADRPIMLLHVSGHLATLNTKALELVGMLHPDADPQGGVIRREADGKTASGVIEEKAIFLAAAKLPQPTIDTQLARLDKAQHIYAANGLTTAQDGASTPDMLPMWREAEKRGSLFIDVDVVPAFWMPWPERDTLPFNAPYDRHLRFAGVKLILDGSPQGRTAWLTKPVPVPPAGRDAHYHGYPQITDEVLRAKLKEAADKGWQVFAHVNGDAAIQQLIDAVAAVDAGRTSPMARTIAIHAQTARTDQLAVMRRLDIQPSFFASHTYYWGDWHREVALGPERADRISPQREAIDVGLRPSIHNDAPVVPPDMIRLIWSAVTRRTRSGDILGPGERVTPYEALMEVTSNAAWQLHEEAEKGVIAPGKLADLVILDSNPLAVPREALDRVRVVATIKEGRTIFGTP
ncbi:amidohydrolase [Flavisphingomonas formosensis]|uniref:amidohydrolase n=1 Tax=Flavisphingomonas formosensis TaxID=861534 RepID=UPI0018DFA08E|nr:amidohydrolase [Sphingomonas formosensis]